MRELEFPSYPVAAGPRLRCPGLRHITASELD